MDKIPEQGFHTQEQLFFRRNTNGSVTITKLLKEKGLFEQTIDVNTWISLIAYVAKNKKGYTGHELAKIFHNE